MNAPTHFDFRNVNALWCSVLAETLARLDARGIVPCLLPELADMDEPADLDHWPEFLP
jgi:glycosyltransferase A (GT-A) superfamily protein (DUF2064 family)